jgi:hypothetical protein
MKTFQLLVWILLLVLFIGCKEVSNYSKDGKGEFNNLDSLFRTNGCGYKMKTRSFDDVLISIQKGQDQYVNRVVSSMGLPANFLIGKAEIDNALALIDGDERVILYDSTFLSSVATITGSDWSALSIIGHEIGHHLAGHTLSDVGSRPDLELEADRFSGFVLHHMGARIEDATKAVEYLADTIDSDTHPARGRRVLAIKNGFLEAEQALKDGDKLFEMENSGSMYEVQIESLEGFCTLRSRSLSPSEYAIVNSGSLEADILNESTILRKVYNGTCVKLLSAIGNTYYILDVKTGERGYILKRYKQRNTLRLIE